MADKGWTARIATAAGAAAGTGAAQLGLGYGLGVVVWPVTPTPDDSAWLGSLGWATWITASATVFGAVLGSRYRGGPGPRTTAAWRFALAACAAVGALVTVALIALPARSAVRLDTYTPQVLAGGYAAVGLLFGLVVAFWAVSSRPVAANLMATGVWLWALAIAAIVVELTVHRDSATYLTSWQFAEVASSGRFGTIYWPSALLTLGAAFLVGVLAAAPAARRGDFGVGAATSGVAGPLLVAVAFLALAPRLTGALGPLESAYLIAPYAVLAGLAGSVLAVAVARTLANRQSRRATTVPASVAGPPVAARPAPAQPARSRSRFFGRAKAQQPQSEPQPSPSVSEIPAGPARSRSDQEIPHQSGSGRTASSAPGQPGLGRTSSATPGHPESSQASAAANPAAGKAAPRSNGKPAPTPVRDPEIASAARPRPRPRKVAADAPKPHKSTVTPPPTAPSVAQINPKPSAEG